MHPNPIHRSPLVAIVAVACALGLPAGAAAQNALDDGSAPPSARASAPMLDATRRLAPIEIDGILDEADWADARVFTGFVQSEPVEGDPAGHDTEVRFLLGDGAVWIAARMWDSDPEGIVRRLTRRDGHGLFDWFVVHLDPNFDRRTGYLFSVSAANVQGDAYMYGDTQMDGAWDAVWSSAVNVDEQGWTVEMRIPLSQIRYEASEGEQAWGINFFRQRVADNERTYYSLVSKLQQGRVSQMARMDGVVVTRPSRRLEVLPYGVSSLHTGPSTAGDPFFDGSDAAGRFGADVSYGLGAAFTLDATINPDFGQVEADPAVINLTAFETFFEERRPFFVEDARVFDYSLSGGRNQLFYSRRVGRSPRGSAPFQSSFEDIPDNATILGAAKLAGRTTSGLSVGALAAVTDQEYGRAVSATDGSLGEFMVEPRAEYGVVSAQQDFNEGASEVRGIFTAMRRDLPEGGGFDWLSSSAFNGGLRFEHQWSDREWALWGFFAGSHVRGSEAAITRLQRAPNHYFQRPDATRFSVDPDATSLTGVDWRMQFERRSGEHWTGALWAAEVTRGFEINDVGFSQTAERLDGGARISYREIVPGSVFRNYNISAFTFHNWSHEALDDTWSLDSWGEARLRGTFNLNLNGQLLSYWNLRGNMSYSPQAMSRDATRGGPKMVSPASLSWSLNVDSDRRKAVSFGADLSLSDDRIGSGGRFGLGGDVRFQPSDNLSFSLNPNWSSSRSSDQYVTASSAVLFDPTFGSRYLFGELEQRTFSMVTRLDWTFTPTLSLQLFAQPLLSSGDYLTYKQLAAASTFEFFELPEGSGTTVGSTVLCSPSSICRIGDTQHVDYDGDGVVDHSFNDRDFNFRSLVGNAVLRWEYRPGSTLFVVWQRRQAGSARVGDFDLSRDAGALFDAPAENRFILKVSYWLGI